MVVVQTVPFLAVPYVEPPETGSLRLSLYQRMVARMTVYRMTPVGEYFPLVVTILAVQNLNWDKT